MPPGRTELCKTLQDTEELLVRHIMMPYIPINRFEVMELIKNYISSVILKTMCQRLCSERVRKCNIPKESFAIITLPFLNATETNCKSKSQMAGILNSN
jgi:hypothetical protein